MSNRIKLLARESLEDFEPMFQLVEQNMGFVPNSMFAMANWPPLLQHFSGLAGTILGSGTLDPGLKQLIALVSSRATGCVYCQAHTSHSAHRQGVSEQKLEAAFEFETSELFSAAEKAALRVALYGAITPNAVEDEHFEALTKFYDEQQKAEIMAVIALFGFLNRWNDSLATELEPKAKAFANAQLSDWTAGKHD